MVHVAAELSTRLVIGKTDVDHDLAGAQMLLRQGIDAARRRHDKLRLGHDAREVARARVADRDGRVLAQQQQGRGTAGDQAAPDDDGAPAADRQLVVLQHLDHGLRGAGKEAVLQSRVDRRHGLRRDAVHVLLRRDRVAHAAQIHALRQRTEEEDTVNRGVTVHRGDHREKLLLRAVRGKNDLADGDAQRAAAFRRAALVGQIALALSDADHAQAGRHAAFRERADPRFQVFAQRLGDRGAPQDVSRHKLHLPDGREGPCQFQFTIIQYSIQRGALARKSGMSEHAAFSLPFTALRALSSPDRWCRSNRGRRRSADRETP